MATNLEKDARQETPEVGGSGDATVEARQRLAEEALSRPESSQERKSAEHTKEEPDHLDISPIATVVGSHKAQGKPEEGGSDTKPAEPGKGDKHGGDSEDNEQEHARKRPGFLKRAAGFLFSTKDDDSLADGVKDFFFGDKDEKSGIRKAGEYVFSAKDDASLVDDVKDFFVGDDDEKSGVRKIGEYVFSTKNDASLVDDIKDFFAGDEDEKSFFSTAWDNVSRAANYVFSLENDNSLLDDVKDFFVGDDDEKGVFDYIDHYLFSLGEGSFWDNIGDWLWGDEDEKGIWDSLNDWWEGDKKGEEPWECAEEEDTQEALEDVAAAEAAYGQASSYKSVGHDDIYALQSALDAVRAINCDDPMMRAAIDAIELSLAQKIYDAQVQLTTQQHEKQYGNAGTERAVSLASADLAHGEITEADRQALTRAYAEMLATASGAQESYPVLNTIQSLLQSPARRVEERERKAA